MLIRPVRSLNGEIKVPGDKSISHRSAIISSISGSKVNIEGFLPSEDCLRTIAILKDLGVKIDMDGSFVTVNGMGIKDLKEPEDILFAGNSGTTIRLMSGLLSAAKGLFVISGDSSINNRPMKRIISPLRELGGMIFGREDNSKPPIVIFESKGLKGKRLFSEVSSAQVKSALILAALHAKGNTVIEQPQISRDHTERMLEYFGIDIKYDGRYTEISPKKDFRPKDIKIPGDLSSAAYIIVAALILKNSHVLIKDVGINPTRSYILDILISMGAEISLKDIRSFGMEPVADIEVRSSRLSPAAIDKDKVPIVIDELPILCIAASFAEGRTVISGAEELRVKESDRIEAMYTQLRKLGVDIINKRDGLEINGRDDYIPKTDKVESFNDHRIALSLAVMAMRSSDGIDIKDFECTDISFPGFSDLIDILSD